MTFGIVSLKFKKIVISTLKPAYHGMVICFFNDVLVIPNLRAIIGVDWIFVFTDWVLKIGKFESVIVIFPIFLNAEKMSFWKSENLTLVCLCKLKVERNDSLNIILKVPDKNRIRLG